MHYRFMYIATILAVWWLECSVPLAYRHHHGCCGGSNAVSHLYIATILAVWWLGCSVPLAYRHHRGCLVARMQCPTCLSPPSWLFGGSNAVCHLYIATILAVWCLICSVPLVYCHHPGCLVARMQCPTCLSPPSWLLWGLECSVPLVYCHHPGCLMARMQCPTCLPMVVVVARMQCPTCILPPSWLFGGSYTVSHLYIATILAVWWLECSVPLAYRHHHGCCGGSNAVSHLYIATILAVVVARMQCPTCILRPSWLLWWLECSVPLAYRHNPSSLVARMQCPTCILPTTWSTNTGNERKFRNTVWG